MGMAPDELGIEPGENIRDPEVPRFGGHLGVEKHLQYQVAQLFAEIGPMPAVDRVENLISLFNRVRLDARKGLFAVPGAAARRSQPLHDRDGLGKQPSRIPAIGIHTSNVSHRQGNWARVYFAESVFRVCPRCVGRQHEPRFGGGSRPWLQPSPALYETRSTACIFP